MDLLKFTAAGSVDDGKSTLIGRLLYDSKSVLTDQLESVRNSKNNISGEDFSQTGGVNLAFLTDGLRAEREQGITIDVAYKYFSTDRRKFIIADTPGHFQYTRNMVTGASNSDLAVILIDATQGINEQTRRHSVISSLLGINYLVVCVNKMDLVNYAERVFKDIVSDFRRFADIFLFEEISFIPVSAKFGDNVVVKSPNMFWYEGKSLLEYLEDVKINSDHNPDSRFPVQWVIHMNNGESYRGYAGKIISGVFRKGDRIINLPSGFGTTIKNIEMFGEEIEEAFAPMSVVIQLNDELDIRRGDLIVKEDNLPEISNFFDAVICWMDKKPLVSGNKYLLQHNSRIVKCIVKEIIHKIDINSFNELKNPAPVELNDICRVKIKTTDPLCYDQYKKNRANGNFILIDEHNNTTAGAGMFL